MSVISAYIQGFFFNLCYVPLANIANMLFSSHQSHTVLITIALQNSLFRKYLFLNVLAVSALFTFIRNLGTFFLSDSREKKLLLGF